MHLKIHDCPMNKIYSNVCPYILNSIADLVSYSKCAKKGDRSCSAEYFCMHYDENRNSYYKLRDKLCLKICNKHHNDKNDWFCYYKLILMENNINVMKDILE